MVKISELARKGKAENPDIGWTTGFVRRGNACCVIGFAALGAGIELDKEWNSTFGIERQLAAKYGLDIVDCDKVVAVNDGEWEADIDDPNDSGFFDPHSLDDVLAKLEELGL